MMIAVGRARRRPASMPVMLAAAGVAFAAVVAVGLLADRADGPGDRASAVEALDAYADAIYPGAQQAGKAIVAGIRPDITDFEAGKISVKVWNADMRARQRELAEAKRVFDRAPAPESVGDAPRLFDRAFDNYLDAVRLLLRAGTLEGTARTELISRAASIGEAGDALFDRGTARIQSARRALGLGADLRFSDKPAR